ncbi:hypothetical protein [Streptomyces sp. NBC_01803]|uniref:hypothetical protein n=1 Tax=Streptomyces sp. NBC_01803 TaxID=2975946 RepID=UPI002DDB863E|nr:hypothetical protein [Streptomyces sp. NBC_01803]WSA45396.1 hypothetical protein OIE51_14985 [Streptomyces sp. NBC_01803]
MASIRTARALGALTAVPLVPGAAAGIARAHSIFPIAGAAGGAGSGVPGDSSGSVATGLRPAIGDGASSESAIAGVDGALAPVFVDQPRKPLALVLAG